MNVDTQGSDAMTQLFGLSYYATRDGRIISTVRSVERDLAGKLSKEGYRYVSLRICGKAKMFTVHSLIALAFIGPRPPGKQINHIDGIKTNNRVENLEYVSDAENKRHSVKIGLRRTGSRHWSAKLTEVSVVEMRRLHASGVKKAELARIFHVDPCTIRDVFDGTCWRGV